MLPIAEQIESYSPDEIKLIIDDHQHLVDLANKLRESITIRPSQSHFRVTALMFFTHSNGILSVIVGSNAEESFIGGAICAERACLTRLRLYDNPQIVKVVVVTDSQDPISPGALCREYLVSAAPPTTPIVIGNCTGKHVAHCELATLWSSPYVYRCCCRSNIVSHAQQLQQSSSLDPTILGVDVQKAQQIREVISAAQSVNTRDHTVGIHPISLSAAILFSDGSVEKTWQMKGLEYGCTVDPIVQLLHFLEANRYNHTNKTVVMLCMIDQYHILHAPFASGRAQLLELGYGDLSLVVHDDAGKLQLTTVEALMPSPPEVCKFLTHDNFDPSR